MEAIDNPSYFSVGKQSAPARSAFSLLRRRNMGAAPSATLPTPPSPPAPASPITTSTSTSSPSSPTTPAMPPCHMEITSTPRTAVPPSARRSFRSLLRSRSVTQAVMQGEPRPSDVAPTDELLTSDMAHCPVVLTDSGAARYYNLTVPLPGRRRHSIGTFLSKERDNAAAAASSSPRTEASTTTPGHEEAAPCSSSTSTKKRTTSNSSTSSYKDHCRTSHARRRCPKCSSKGGTRGAEMEDILIVSCKQSQAAQLWVSYLSNCFEQISKMRNRPPFRIMCVGVEDVVGSTPLSLALEEKMVRVKLQIVIVCSQLLDHIYRHPGPGTNLGRLLQPDRVIAMLLGVEEAAVTEQHRAALISYQQWKKLTVRDQDEVFVRNFLDLAMNTLAKSWRQQRKHGEKAQFSLHPKKVREGHNKILVLLNEPIEKDDKINITVDKNGEKLEISTITKRNPYTLHFLVPESCLEVSTMVTVQVEKNGTPLGGHLLKCESKMRQLDQILRSSDNPLEFMCQTLGFSPGDREHLDNFLVTAFQRNVPQNFSLLQTMGMAHHTRSHSSPEEYPTLLHFAARFGLEKLAWQLLECPGGEQACEIRNVCELTPAEMAEVSGHNKLAQSLRGYMQMNEFTSMYSYLKIMSEGNSKSSGFNEAEYHRPRPLSETYQVPPSARNLIEQNYQVPPSARPYTPQTNLTVVSNPIPDSEMAGYMEMHSSNFVSLSPSKHNLDFTSSSTKLENRTPSPDMTSSHHLDQELSESGPEAILSKAGCFKKSQDHLNHGIQDELVEIINDFKNNVFTISEVEKLVEAWKNRNDVKQSFKEKQQQLIEMREQYERLQQCMKEQMKRPTPFERVRNFFKGKSKVKDNTSDTTTQSTDSLKTVTSDSLPICHRPASSLSLHSVSSSSSSGRMSTVSGCSGTSLGDSGTHSDAEDRKNTFESVKMNGKAHIQNYEVPPTPRPFQSRISPPRLTTCIENRPPQPVPRSDIDKTVTKEEDIYDNYVTPDLIPSPEINGKTENYKTPLLGQIKHKNGPSTTADAEYLHIQIQENVCHHTLESPETPLTPTVDYMNLHLGLEPSHLPDYMNLHLTKNGSAPPIPPRGDLVLPCPQK